VPIRVGRRVEPLRHQCAPAFAQRQPLRHQGDEPVALPQNVGGIEQSIG
jgi:hypothetical protein